MHPRRLQRGALSIALAGSLLVAGSASAKKLRFLGWTPLSDYVSAGLAEGGSFRLTVPTRAGETEVALHPVDVNAADYHAEEAVQNGERRGRRRPALHTFAGSIEKAGTHRVRHGKGGDFARLSREASGRVSGLMRVDGVLYDLAADPAAGDLVLQVNEVDPDELSKVLGACGAAVDEALAGATVAADASATPSDATGAPASAAAGALHEVELGTEADAPFVAQTGGVSEANARIVSIVNAINGIYEFDLGLTLKVSFQRAWNGSDPYTSTNSDALLTQFRSNFLGHVSAPTDDAVLFSGRDFDGSIVGRAYVASACSPYRFGVNQFYQQSDSLTRLIAAHEMGHTLGGSHTTDGIMAPSINPNVTWFGATSQQQIGDYVDAVSCLAEVDVGGPPVLDPIGPQDAPENATLSLQLSATDPEGGAISWSALPLPIGASLSPSGLFQWKPPLDSVGCGGFVDHSVTFRATDPDGNHASETVVISVIDTPTGSPPAIDAPANRSALSDRPLSIPLSAVDEDGDNVSFAAVSPPTGLNVSTSGMLTWTPSFEQIGPHELSLIATDCTDKTSGQSVTIDVVSSAPHLTSLNAASGGKGTEIALGGQNFAGKKVRVYFGPKKAKAYAVTDTSLLVRVPKKKKDLPDTISLSVMRDGVVSDNTLPFTYTPEP
jgi:Metallo-peptidase family M12/Putative Ig domain/IPT/TIG domain